MKLVFFGNCQAQSLQQMYDAFVAPITGGETVFVNATVKLNEADAAAIEAADVIVELIANFSFVATLPTAPSRAQRLRVPVVGAPFLWPYSGTAHPESLGKYGNYRPYPAERSDAWLLARLKEGVAPDDAVDRYLAADMARVARLDRRMEMELDMQAAREAGTPYRFADIIAQRFRLEPLFRTAYHPTLRISKHAAEVFLQELGAPSAAQQAVHDGMIEDFYLGFELPVHPGIAAHYGLRWADAHTRYAFYHEDNLTFEAWARRFVRCQAYPEITAALAAARLNRPNALALITEALAIAPESPWVNVAYAALLIKDGRYVRAVALLKKALANRPDIKGAHSLLAACYDHMDLPHAAIGALRDEVTLQPFDTALRADLARRLAAFGNSAPAQGVPNADEADLARRRMVRRRAAGLGR